MHMNDFAFACTGGLVRWGRHGHGRGTVVVQNGVYVDYGKITRSPVDMEAMAAGRVDQLICMTKVLRGTKATDVQKLIRDFSTTVISRVDREEQRQSGSHAGPLKLVTRDHDWGSL